MDTLSWTKGAVKRAMKKVGFYKKKPSVTIHRQNEQTWPFDGFAAWAAAYGPDKQLPPALLEVRRTEAQLLKRLAGDVRETWVSHELCRVEAATVAIDISSPSRARIILHHLASHFRPTRVLELGSAFGIASLAMASALRDVDGVQFDGIEYEAWRAAIADEHVRSMLGDRARVHAGRIEDLIQAIAADRGPFDFVFVDAVHTYEDTFNYHRLLCDVVADGAIVVYDDICWSSEMQRFWADVVKEPQITDALSCYHRWGVARYAGRR